MHDIFTAAYRLDSKIRTNKYRYKYWYHTWIILDHCFPLPYPDLNHKKALGSVPIFLWCQSLQAFSSLFPQIFQICKNFFTIQIVWISSVFDCFGPHPWGRKLPFFVWFPWNFRWGNPPWPPPGPCPLASQGHHPSSPSFGCLWHHHHHPSRLRPARYCWWLKSGDHQLGDR